MSSKTSASQIFGTPSHNWDKLPQQGDSQLFSRIFIFASNYFGKVHKTCQILEDIL